VEPESVEEKVIDAKVGDVLLGPSSMGDEGAVMSMISEVRSGARGSMTLGRFLRKSGERWKEGVDVKDGDEDATTTTVDATDSGEEDVVILADEEDGANSTETEGVDEVLSAGTDIVMAGGSARGVGSERGERVASERRGERGEE